jgi:hypothetical protein
MERSQSQAGHHSSSTMEDWDADNDPNASVHPGAPLAEGEGDAPADEGGMIEVNWARIDDVAASLVVGGCNKLKSVYP